MATNIPVERTGKSAKKNRKREQLIIALLQQSDLEKAAASIGISTSTAYRIRQTPEFQTEYLQARRDAVAQAITRSQQGCGAASTTLLKIMMPRAKIFTFESYSTTPLPVRPVSALVSAEEL
jgi:hypothetical protein